MVRTLATRPRPAIWREVSRGETVSGIVALLAARYAAKPDVIARDVGDFIAASISKDLLIEAMPGPCAGAPETASP